MVFDPVVNFQSIWLADHSWLSGLDQGDPLAAAVVVKIFKWVPWYPLRRTVVVVILRGVAPN